MELGLSLGEAPKAFQFMERSSKRSKGSLGFFMEEEERGIEGGRQRERRDERDDSVETPVQLELLPLVPVPRYPSSIIGHAWQAENGNSDSSATRGFDVNQLPVGEEMEDGAVVSSPNSAASSFQRDFSIYRRGPGAKTDADLTAGSEIDPERASSRASDEEENGLTRKKLRLSKEQSAFLEESFKEHNTLNPKQKLALAKQLNLRPRQVEVWFQNRRARTKLKQTEVDCEYLKRCCETLTDENRRLQKELQELRALKTAQPFYMQLPATTLTMCPSCERVATTNGPGHGSATDPASKAASFNPKNNRFYPFPQPHQSAAS